MSETYTDFTPENTTPSIVPIDQPPVIADKRNSEGDLSLGKNHPTSQSQSDSMHNI